MASSSQKLTDVSLDSSSSRESYLTAIELQDRRSPEPGQNSRDRYPSPIQLQDMKDLNPDIMVIGTPEPDTYISSDMTMSCDKSYVESQQPVRESASFPTSGSGPSTFSEETTSCLSGLLWSGMCLGLRICRTTCLNWICPRDLDNNEVFDFIVNKMSLDHLEEAYFYKIETEMGKSWPFHRNNSHLNFGTCDFMNLIKQLPKEPSDEEITFKLAEFVNVALQGNAFRIYKFFGKQFSDTIKIFSTDELDNKLVLEETQAHVQVLEAARRSASLYATRTLSPLQLSDAPPSVFHNKRLSLAEQEYAIAVPILFKNGYASHVIEIWRTFCYQKTDAQIANSFMVWGSLAIYYCKEFTAKKNN